MRSNIIHFLSYNKLSVNIKEIFQSVVISSVIEVFRCIFCYELKKFAFSPLIVLMLIILIITGALSIKRKTMLYYETFRFVDSFGVSIQLILFARFWALKFGADILLSSIIYIVLFIISCVASVLYVRRKIKEDAYIKGSKTKNVYLVIIVSLILIGATIFPMFIKDASQQVYYVALCLTNSYLGVTSIFGFSCQFMKLYYRFKLCDDIAVFEEKVN